MADSNFYLGRAYDPIKQTVTEKEVTYDPADLTTHAAVPTFESLGPELERLKSIVPGAPGLSSVEELLARAHAATQLRQLSESVEKGVVGQGGQGGEERP